MKQKNVSFKYTKEANNKLFNIIIVIYNKDGIFFTFYFKEM